MVPSLVADFAAVGNGADQAQVAAIRRADVQVVDGMAQAGQRALQIRHQRSRERAALQVKVLRQCVIAEPQLVQRPDILHGAQQRVALSVDLERRLRAAQRHRCVGRIGASARVSPLLEATQVQLQARLGARGGNRRVDVDVAMRAERQLRAGAPFHARVHVDIAGLRAVINGPQLDVAVVQVGRQRVGADAAVRLTRRARADREVSRIGQPRSMLAADRLGGDHGACRHRHLRGRRFHKPALAAVGRAGVQLAGHGDAVIDHVAQQHDLAVLAGGQRLGLRDAGVVDDGAGQIARGLGPRRSRLVPLQS
ncbi:hypothetical protein G6F65_017365 [Rhizopus arrhizus]|nr:hypothetical protein G6F65_017365 [Rhizopus arrhizus]